MLQPRRGDVPLIKVAGTSECAERCRQPRLHCGKSEPFKWGRGAGIGVGAKWGGTTGWGFGTAPSRRSPVGMPPSPAPAPAV